MPPLDATNLLPLDAANSIGGSLGSVALDDLGTPPPAGGKPGSLGPNKSEGDSEVEEEVPWVDLSLKEEEVTDGEIEEEGKVNVSEDVSEEESDELTLEAEEGEEEEKDLGVRNDGSSEKLESSEEIESSEEKEEAEEHSLRDLAKFPVKNSKNVLTKRYIVIIIIIHHWFGHIDHQVCVTDTDCELVSAEQEMDYKCFQYM